MTMSPDRAQHRSIFQAARTSKRPKSSSWLALVWAETLSNCQNCPIFCRDRGNARVQHPDDPGGRNAHWLRVTPNSMQSAINVGRLS
jgi:hypothetical protein